MMFQDEELALFALEEEFENAATATNLTVAARAAAMTALLSKMHATVMTGYRQSPVLGAHLADIALDYLLRADVAPAVVRAAFNPVAQTAPEIANPHERVVRKEVERAALRIMNRAPARSAILL